MHTRPSHSGSASSSYVLGEIGRRDLVGVVHDRPCPDREAVPVAVGITEFTPGSASSSTADCDGLEQTLLGCGGEVAGVDGDVHIGLRLVTLGSDALSQLGVVAGEELDLDAGLLGELLEGRLDAVVTAAVHAQDVVVTTAGGR